MFPIKSLDFIFLFVVGCTFVGGIGCGAGDSAEKATEWISIATEQELVDSTSTSVGPDTLGDVASPVDSDSSKAAELVREFQFNHTSSTPDDAKLAALQTQYGSDIAGVTIKSSPSHVSQVFVQLLHADDLQTAERLLTLKSRATIHESDLELGPIAGPNSQYVIGDSRYATSLQDLAYVDCFVFDPELVEQGDQETGKYKVTWVLRQESVFGWRIYGMVHEDNGQLRMVNFENPQHALAISQMHDEGASHEVEKMRNAGTTSSETIR